MLIFLAALLGLGFANELPEPKFIYLKSGILEVSFEGSIYYIYLYYYMLYTYPRFSSRARNVDPDLLPCSEASGLTVLSLIQQF